MKYSIRKQFASVLCAFIIGTILLCLFINNTFLEKYYLSEKQKVLTGAYHEMNRGADYKGDQKEEFVRSSIPFVKKVILLIYCSIQIPEH